MILLSLIYGSYLLQVNLLLLFIILECPSLNEDAVIQIEKKSFYAIQSLTITCGNAPSLVHYFQNRKPYLPIRFI